MSLSEVVLAGEGRPDSHGASHRGIAASRRPPIVWQVTGRIRGSSLRGRHLHLSGLGRAAHSRLLLFGQSTCQTQ